MLFPSSLSQRLQQYRVTVHWPTSRLWILAVVIIFILASSFFTYRPQIRVPSFSLSEDWSRYAYASYATNDESLCNSVMLFESLARLGSKADRLLLHPSDWSASDDSGRTAILFKKLQQYKVKLQPIEIQEFKDVDPTWSKGFTKLLAFNQTQYDRVLSLDSDATILQPMDELFHLPPSPIAMPRAYWLDDDLNAQIILFQPSATELERIQKAYDNRPGGNTEMDMLNTIYKKHCMIIPHRPYALLSGEFKSKSHEKYMGGDDHWDPDAVMHEAKFLHFSDWPLPKPWQDIQKHQWDSVFPPCDGQSDCRDRHTWINIYRDFLTRRNDICGIEFMPTSGIPSLDV